MAGVFMIMMMTKVIIIIKCSPKLELVLSPEPATGTCEKHENLDPSFTELRVWLEG